MAKENELIPVAGGAYARSISGGLHGLNLSDDERAAQIRALIREKEGYEARARGAEQDEDEQEQRKWERRAAQAAEQLKARGVEGEAPQKRAAKRTRQPEGVETR